MKALCTRGFAAMLCACSAATLHAQAPTYPAKPVRIVVGFAAGGGTDVAARVVAQKLTANLGQTFVVDNRPGASGTIGAEVVAKSPPDGYTLLVGTQTNYAVAPAMYPRVGYDPGRDFVPITIIATSPLLLVVHPSLAIDSVAQLIALAKSRPGQLTFGVGGAGTTPHMSTVLFKLMTGVDMVMVAYKGEAPAVTDLLGGQITLMFSNLPVVLPHARSGKLRGLAVSSAQRVPTAAEFPAVAESGLPGFEVETWFGLLAPAGTPRQVIAKLNAETVRAMNLPDVKEKLAAQGLFVATSSADQFAAYLKAEIAKWATVVKESGAKVE
jgi:tripartite-type tricarboxylate transporter receptor subunit TctC